MLGNKIRELRKEAKYTQEELAQLLRSKYGLMNRQSNDK